MNYVAISNDIPASEVPQAFSLGYISHFRTELKNGPSDNSLSPSIYWWNYLNEFRCFFQISSFGSEETIVAVKELMDMVA